MGHFAVAFLLILLFPQVPAWVPLVGVSFPDLLWAILIWVHKEEILVDKSSPLQKSLIFRNFPYSHSLVIGNVISVAVGGALAVSLHNLSVLPIFAIASVSHWALDAVVHLHDLPILGFDGDRKIGFGLWKWGAIAFVVELLLFVASAVIFVGPSSLVLVLTIGILFHVINANSFFGFSRRNPFGSSDIYAGVALVGFGVLTAIYSSVL